MGFSLFCMAELFNQQIGFWLGKVLIELANGEGREWLEEIWSGGDC